MLTHIKLTNFKCFKEETNFPLSTFNLFTGVNGNGKSTLIQSLLLMRQSIEHDLYTTELILNGRYVNLGCFNDIRNREVSKNEPIFFEFGIRNTEYNTELIGAIEGSVRYQLKPNSDDMSLHIPELIVRQNDFGHWLKNPAKCCLSYDANDLYKLYGSSETSNEFRLIKLAPCLLNKEKKSLSSPDNFKLLFDNESYKTYPLLKDGRITSISKQPPEYKKSLSDNKFLIFNDEADQDNLGFEKIHFISADRVGPQEFYFKSTLPKFRHVGTRGEFTVNLLDKLAQELVTESLCLGEDAETLITQTEAWLGKILNPLKLEVPQSKTNILELFIGDFKPANVGFGYSSILPIIVSGLIAKPGEKIIIENPEIHLHPKAQSALIEFLVKVANTGVQIFIESHSDHVLNALRLATKGKSLTPEDVSILFFTEENGHSKIIKPTIDQNGRIDQWPECFFDENAKSLASLAAGLQPRTKAPKAPKAPKA